MCWSLVTRGVVVAAAVGSFALGGCSSDSAGTPATTSADGATPGSDDAPASTNAPPVLVETAGDKATIRVTVGKDDFTTSGGTRVLSVPRGTNVTLKLTDPNGDQEYHLHGYDLEAAAKQGDTATIAFVADHAGQFDVESHVSAATLLVLVVE